MSRPSIKGLVRISDDNFLVPFTCFEAKLDSATRSESSNRLSLLFNHNIPHGFSGLGGVAF
jgi:hypothetical protein